MTKTEWRGHSIINVDNEWKYEDTMTLCSTDKRGCGYCKLSDTPEGHDGCLGVLQGIMNACCGHGNKDFAYIQLLDGSVIQGELAVEKQNELKAKL